MYLVIINNWRRESSQLVLIQMATSWNNNVVGIYFVILGIGFGIEIVT